VPAETPVRFHPEADEEMHVIADWYDEHSQSGDDFLAALGEIVDDIAAAPWRWPIVQGIAAPAHRRLLWRFPYNIYPGSTTRAEVVLVGHARTIPTRHGPP